MASRLVELARSASARSLPDVADEDGQLRCKAARREPEGACRVLGAVGAGRGRMAPSLSSSVTEPPFPCAHIFPDSEARAQPHQLWLPAAPSAHRCRACHPRSTIGRVQFALHPDRLGAIADKSPAIYSQKWRSAQLLRHQLNQRAHGAVRASSLVPSAQSLPDGQIAADVLATARRRPTAPSSTRRLQWHAWHRPRAALLPHR